LLIANSCRSTRAQDVISSDLISKRGEDKTAYLLRFPEGLGERQALPRGLPIHLETKGASRILKSLLDSWRGSFGHMDKMKELMERKEGLRGCGRRRGRSESELRSKSTATPTWTQLQKMPSIEEIFDE